MMDLFKDMSPTMLPVQRPRWTVTIQLPSCIFVAQHVVAHDRKYCYNHNMRDVIINKYDMHKLG